MKTHRITPRNCYLTLHLWLRKQCCRLSQRQRRRLVYTLFFVYALCGVVVLVDSCRSFFSEDVVPAKKEDIQREKQARKLLCRLEKSIQQITSSYGKETTRPH